MQTIPLPSNQASLNALRAMARERSVLAGLEALHAGAGDIFQIPLPGFRPVVLAGPEANRFVLVQERDNLLWRNEQDPVVRLLHHGVLVEDGDVHDTLRRRLNPALHKRMLEGYASAMVESTDRVMAGWPAAPAPVDMLVEMRRIALLILMQTLFHVDFAADLEKMWAPILKAIHYISPGPWLFWPGVPRPGYGRALAELDAYLFHLIVQRRAAAANHDDMLGMLIEAGMPDALIRDQLLTIIIAGHDTTTALLAWMLQILSTRPTIQARVQEEVDAVVGSARPDFGHVKELRYLEQVMNETLRLYPPIHLGSRVAARALEFQGHRIAEGRRVLYSIYLGHRDPRTWSDPAEFRPERFAPDCASAIPAYAFMPFGGGPRNCIGMAYAQVEVKLVLARILQRLSVISTGRRVRLYMGATLEPRPGVEVTLHTRA